MYNYNGSIKIWKWYKYQIHSTQISKWKSVARDAIVNGVKNNCKKNKSDDQDLIDELYKQIGQLKVELEWLKKIFIILWKIKKI